MKSSKATAPKAFPAMSPSLLFFLNDGESGPRFFFLAYKTDLPVFSYLIYKPAARF
jgi:hypothetical protein